MLRLAAIRAGLLIAPLLAAPANTIATFNVLDAISGFTTFDGTFEIELTTQKIEQVSLTVKGIEGVYPGIAYSGTSADSYTSIISTRLVFRDSAAILPPLGGKLLILEFGLNILTDLSPLLGGIGIVGWRRKRLAAFSTIRA